MAARSLIVSALRGAVALAQLKIHLQHVDHLLAEQTTHRRKGVGLQHLVDLLMNLRRISLGISRPLRGDSIELIFGILQA